MAASKEEEEEMKDTYGKHLSGVSVRSKTGATIHYRVHESEGSNLCHVDEMARSVKNYSEEQTVSWGYEGTGPLQLALFVLYYMASGGFWNYFYDCRDICEPAKQLAIKHHEAFMREVVANWGDNWEITKDEVMNWIKEKEANGTSDNRVEPKVS